MSTFRKGPGAFKCVGTRCIKTRFYFPAETQSLAVKSRGRKGFGPGQSVSDDGGGELCWVYPSSRILQISPASLFCSQLRDLCQCCLIYSVVVIYRGLGFSPVFRSNGREKDGSTIFCSRPVSEFDSEGPSWRACSVRRAARKPATPPFSSFPSLSSLFLARTAQVIFGVPESV